MSAVMPFVKQFLTHAQIRNARFNQSSSVFVSAKQRVDDYCQLVPGARNELNNAIKDFKSKNKNMVWDQVKFVKAEKCKLSQIRIDDTMNRPLDWKHVIKIIKKFSSTRVMAVNVYEDPLAPGCFIAWDGQHTTIVLYIISVLILGQAIGDIEIPITISPTSNKEEIRINFIELNSEEGKLALSVLALMEQKIYGVTVDNSANPKWIDAANKFKILADVDIFLTSKDYRDQNEAGALTHIKSIDSEPLDIVEMFAKYWSYRKNYENRRVESKELIHMNYLFNLAKKDDIVWGDEDLESIVDIFWNCFNCEFTGGDHLDIFWQKLDKAYQSWYDKVYREPLPGEEDFRPTRLKMTKDGKHQETYGAVFMIKQLETSGFTGALPTFKHEAGFLPKKTDLWAYNIKE